MGVIVIIFAAAILVVWLFLDEERERRLLWRDFGTTGFSDVDARYRREATLEAEIAFYRAADRIGSAIAPASPRE